jgi:hypothetical protein
MEPRTYFVYDNALRHPSRDLVSHCNVLSAWYIFEHVIQ